MPLRLTPKVLVLGLCATLSANAAFAQGQVLEQEPYAHRYHETGDADLSHLQGLFTPDLPVAEGFDFGLPSGNPLRPNANSGNRNNHGAAAVAGVIALGLIAAAAQSNAASSRGLRLECPSGTELQARPLDSGTGGVVHNGYRWVCAY